MKNNPLGASTKRFQIVILALSWSIVNFCPPAIAQDDSGPIRGQIDAIWRGFDGLQCRLTEEIESRVNPDERSTTEIEFIWKDDGRSVLSWNRKQASLTTWGDIREDGRSLTQVHYFANDKKVVNRIIVNHPLNRPGIYGGILFPGLKALLPGGRTLAAILEGGGTLQAAGYGLGRSWKLVAKLDQDDIECFLDEGHQFLPATMTIRNQMGRQEFRTKKFDIVDGFCYPAEGECDFTGPKGSPQVSLKFRMDRVSFNHAVAAEKFHLDEFPAGADVYDDRVNTKTFVGGKSARLKLLRENPPLKMSPPQDNSIEVPIDATAVARRWSQLAAMITAFVAGATGVYLRIRAT